MTDFHMKEQHVLCYIKHVIINHVINDVLLKHYISPNSLKPTEIILIIIMTSLLYESYIK